MAAEMLMYSSVPKNWSAGKPRFRTGVVYAFKTIHSLRFYHDARQGCRQAIEAANPGLIEEFADFATAKRAKLDGGASERRMDEDEDE